LKDEELEIFESGAGLLHLARKSEKLMPRDPVGEAETLQWTIAALNSIEMVTVPWWFLKMCGDENDDLTGWMGKRLDQVERVLTRARMARRRALHRRRPVDGGRAARFRGPLFRRPPATEAYVTRVTGRTSFKKAHADQIGHFEAADQKRAEERSN
jgi:glutathione S-transferase